jgi:hypothetical protein
MTTWRIFENNRIDAHAAAAHKEIWRMTQQALAEINAKKCYVARSIGQQRRFSKITNGGKTK